MAAFEAAKPVPRLTTEGPFRHTRISGPSDDLRRDSRSSERAVAIVPLPLVMFVIQRAVIGREERYLERTFGEE
jgi:hypothetical protein